jgi:hypothetical protein
MSGTREMADNLHVALLQNSMWCGSCHDVNRQHTQIFLAMHREGLKRSFILNLPLAGTFY